MVGWPVFDGQQQRRQLSPLISYHQSQVTHHGRGWQTFDFNLNEANTTLNEPALVTR